MREICLLVDRSEQTVLIRGGVVLEDSAAMQQIERLHAAGIAAWSLRHQSIDHTTKQSVLPGANVECDPGRLGACGDARLACLVDDVSGGGVCRPCRTHSDSKISDCSFVPPSAALTICARGEATSPMLEALSHAVPRSRPRVSYEHIQALLDTPGAMSDEARQIAQCMIDTEKRLSGCCPDEKCIPRVAGSDLGDHVLGTCRPSRD